MFTIWCLLLVIFIGYARSSILSADGIYDFDMDWYHESTGKITRKMRLYLCVNNEEVFMSMVDLDPINGFDQFPIGLAQFKASDTKAIKGGKSETDSVHGIAMDSSGALVEATFTLTERFHKKGPVFILRIKHFLTRTGEHFLQMAKDEKGKYLEMDEEERASKCWIPYHHDDDEDIDGNTKNIESLNQNGKSIWKTDVFPGLNVYDLDIFNHRGTGNGCWAWTDENGKAIAAEGVGTAGGMNYQYQYWFGGDLMTLQWTDRGTWITDKTKYCHHGWSLFMITGKDEAAVTFSCDDGVTGSQMIMHRQTTLDELRCPIIRSEKVDL